jgi:NAD(P)-dependent dehydrogenase (short-subunit alcohol dehydrogenase family)
VIPPRPRAVVTGAGSGLGAAFCELLSRRGGRVIASDIDPAAAAATAARCPGAHPIGCDVSRLEEVEAVAAEAERVLGGVDLVINNAGVAVVGQIGEVPIADWRWCVDINLWGVIHGCHVFAPRLRAARRGHIINVASAAGLLSPPSMGPYNTTKAAVIALSETLAADLSADGVGVSVLCPTFFRSNLVRSSRTSVDGALRRAARRLVEQSGRSAADIAGAALAAAEGGALHIAPQLDGRWLWRLKRLSPALFRSLAPRAAARLRSLGGADTGEAGDTGEAREAR